MVACQNSQSQFGEERALFDTVLGRRTKGTYVEIGAHDGLRFSNTLMLHTCHGWSGVLVEADPDLALQLKRNAARLRPSAFAYAGAVCSPPKETVTFLKAGNTKFKVTGAVLDTMATSYERQWHRSWQNKSDATIVVKCAPMSNYLSHAGVSHVDLFSLDVEGAELEVLETLDFAATRVETFVIELDGHNREKDWKVRRLMRNLGYLECTGLVRNSAVFVRTSRLNWRAANPAANSSRWGSPEGGGAACV